jgi:hypothetical protein
VVVPVPVGLKAFVRMLSHLTAAFWKSLLDSTLFGKKPLVVVPDVVGSGMLG